MREGETPFERALSTLGELLAERRHRYELIAIGGGALLLLGLMTRPTQDVDIVGAVEQGAAQALTSLPDPLRAAVEDTAALLGLRKDWLNLGPAALVEFGLPEGFLARATVRRWGGLVLHIASRSDQICFKLYAAVDQGPRSKHFQDLRELRPTADELRVAADWAVTHDSSEGFRTELRGALRDLGVEDESV